MTSERRRFISTSSSFNTEENTFGCGPFLTLPGEHGLPEDQDQGIFHRHAHFEQGLSRGNIKLITHTMLLIFLISYALGGNYVNEEYCDVYVPGIKLKTISETI